jgi:hypothetical protein
VAQGGGGETAKRVAWLVVSVIGPVVVAQVAGELVVRGMRAAQARRRAAAITARRRAEARVERMLRQVFPAGVEL